MSGIEHFQFPNIGFTSAKLTEAELAPIKKEIEEIRNNFESSITHNHNLAGNIKKEFSFKNLGYLATTIFPYIKEDPYLKSKISGNVSIRLIGAWINFQEKYEFNPPHDHDGDLSFVIWISIPYNINSELTNSPSVKSNYPVAGHFSFLYTSSLGGIAEHLIPADRSMENTLLIFPASLKHCVYPFYTSDEFRISVSGNFAIDK
jgi:hypothetical protein